MVIAPGGDERGLVAEPLHELEPEHAAVEVERAVEVGDLQVDVADPRPGADRVDGFGVFGHGGSEPRQQPGRGCPART